MPKEMGPDLREVFTYDAETGELRWNVSRGKAAAGSLANSRTYDGRYYKATYKGTVLLAHRLAWYLHTGEQPPDVIDHADGDGLNNCWDNLRAASSSSNQCNISATVKSTSGIKGVFPIRGGKLWRAEVCINGARYQKHSVDPLKLEAWVKAKRESLHGKFARH